MDSAFTNSPSYSKNAKPIIIASPFCEFSSFRVTFFEQRGLHDWGRIAGKLESWWMAGCCCGNGHCLSGVAGHLCTHTCKPSTTARWKPYTQIKRNHLTPWCVIHDYPLWQIHDRLSQPPIHPRGDSRACQRFTRLFWVGKHFGPADNAAESCRDGLWADKGEHEPAKEDNHE